MTYPNSPRTPNQEQESLPGLESALVTILAQAPAITIPETFAAKVTQRAIEQPSRPETSLSGWGPRLTLVSGALLPILMLALAPHARPSLANLPFDAELLLLTELGALLLFTNRILHPTP